MNINYKKYLRRQLFKFKVISIKNQQLSPITL